MAHRTDGPIHVLYVVYWGVLEPLGQSLVLPQVLRFAARGVRVTLVSFEKPHHRADREAFQRHRDRFRDCGIHWIALRYHKTPTVPATAFDVLQGGVRSLVRSVRGRPDLVHGRTYVGGIIGSLAARAMRRPWVFHNEGFWPDEQIAIGRWHESDRAYRAAKRLELSLYRRAEGVIALSQAARDIVLGYRADRSADSVVVVPSCVDLEMFRPAAHRSGGPVRLVYTGSLGGRYRIHELARFIRAARDEMPGTMVTLYSHSSPELIRTELRRHGVDDGWWSLDFKPHAQLAEAVAAHHAGLHFLAPGINALVGSPTKIGEYWAAGLPVVTTPGVSDVDATVRRDRVGVIVESDTDEACRRAARELKALLDEPGLVTRCRQAAEETYALDHGVETQLALYRRLTGRSGSPNEQTYEVVGSETSHG
jgi:glycosyltransferase involved in cell wall biosynthesis